MNKEITELVRRTATQLLLMSCLFWVIPTQAAITQVILENSIGIINIGGKVTIGVPPEKYEFVLKELGITAPVFERFKDILGVKKIPPEKLVSTLIDMAKRYREFLAQADSFTSDEPEILALLKSARKEVAQGNFEQADQLYNQVSEKNEAVFKKIAERIQELQELKDKRFLSAAEAKYANGELKMILLEYLQAANYYQKAVELLPPKYEEKLGLYLNQTATAFREAGQYNQAKPLNERGLAIFEKVLGKEHLLVAISINNLAGLYEAQGNYSQAKLLNERSLAIREKVLGREHLLVATSLSNLAGLHQAQGNYSEAKQLHERSLAIREKVLGEEHPDVAKSLNNLASLYTSQGNYSEAKSLYERSLAIREKVLGKEHPDVASSLNNLATLHYDQGNYNEAKPLHKRSLAIREKVLGKEHPDVAISLNNLAGLYQAQGNYSEAKPLYERSLAIWEKVLDKEHPNVASSLNNLATLHYDQGNYNEAKPLHERSLAIREKVLGKEHPDVAFSLNNLAMLYKAQGNYRKAKPLFERSVVIYEKVSGKEHPNTLTVKTNLTGLMLIVVLENRLKVRVAEVISNSPAEKLGLQVDDIFVQYDNHPVVNKDLFTFGRNQEPKEGATKPLKVLRNGQELTFMLFPGEIGAVLEDYIIEK